MMALRHHSNKPLELKQLDEERRSYVSNSKPVGLWFEIVGGNPDWITWCAKDNYGKDRFGYSYILELNLSNICLINNENQFLDFTELYKINKCGFGLINFTEVMTDFKGIIISPYLHSCRGIDWYHGWDVASGCVWDITAITKVEQISAVYPEWKDESLL